MTKSTAVVYHKDYLKHFPSDSCPDRMARLVETLKLFISEGLLKSIEVRTPAQATEDDLLRVHRKEYVEQVKDLSLFGGGALDADTEVKPRTFELAKLAAGGAMLAGEYIVRSMYKNSFALVRPPGNHATKSAGMEYCYFNNAAVMIGYLKAKYKLEKILILSWSAHAANGTMDIFYNDKGVLDISIHQDPQTIFPNTGFIDQTGEGDGEGYTVNIPVPEGTSDADYVYILENFVLPLAESFKPELIVISAGQDAHNDDVTSDLCLTEACYGVMTNMMKNAAEKLCGGKIVVVLEGGYEPESLARSNLEIVNSLIGESKAQVTGTPKEETIALVNKLKEKFSKYHKIETNSSNLP
jgi:acetoin utilization deacetylase AcuC-like enzyme